MEGGSVDLNFVHDFFTTFLTQSSSLVDIVPPSNIEIVEADRISPLKTFYMKTEQDVAEGNENSILRHCCSHSIRLDPRAKSPRY